VVYLSTSFDPSFYRLPRPSTHMRTHLSTTQSFLGNLGP
jgi:hypothetical protein